MNQFKISERRKRTEQQAKKEDLLHEIDECEDEDKRELLVK